MATETEVTPVAVPRRVYTPPVLATPPPDATIERLEQEIDGLHTVVSDLKALVSSEMVKARTEISGLQAAVGSSQDELAKARKELREVLTLLQDQHRDQKEARERAATERREARAKLFQFLERMLGPFVDDPWFRRGALAGLSVLALVLGGVGYVQLSKDGVTVGQKGGAPAAEELNILRDQELEHGSSSRP